MTNLEMLQWGIEHIAKNHNFNFDTESWKDDGSICIWGGCNVPTLSDVQMLCQDCKVPDYLVESSSFGIDVFLPEGEFGIDREWANAQYEKPVNEFWRRVS